MTNRYLAAEMEGVTRDVREGQSFAGALLARLFIGQGIDHYGTRRLWMTASLLFIFGCYAISALIYVASKIYRRRKEGLDLGNCRDRIDDGEVPGVLRAGAPG